MQAWETFATITGGAAAALAGLLFVALSINLTIFTKSPLLQVRALLVLSLFVTVLFTSILIVIPGQSYRTLGAELIVLAVIITLEVVMFRQPLPPNSITSLLLLAAGIVLMLGVRAGLYVVVVAVFVALGFSFELAWVLLVRVTEKDYPGREG